MHVRREPPTYLHVRLRVDPRFPGGICPVDHQPRRAMDDEHYSSSVHTDDFSKQTLHPGFATFARRDGLGGRTRYGTDVAGFR